MKDMFEQLLRQSIGDAMPKEKKKPRKNEYTPPKHLKHVGLDELKDAFQVIEAYYHTNKQKEDCEANKLQGFLVYADGGYFGRPDTIMGIEACTKQLKLNMLEEVCKNPSMVIAALAASSHNE